jgi:hypothetical protein
MADRASFGLAYKAQSAFGTLATATGYKPFRLSEWNPGLNFNTVEDDSIIPGTRLGGVGRAGTSRVQPTFRVNLGTTEYDDWLAAMFQASWVSNVLTQGLTRTYFSVEDRQSDAASYLLLRDVIPNTFRVRLSPNALVPGEFGCLATVVSSSGTPTASLATPGSDTSFDSWSGSCTYAGGAFDLTSLEFTMDNRGETRDTLFNRYPSRIVFNSDRVTGQFTCQYTGPSRLADTIGFTANALSFTLNGFTSIGGAKSLTFLMAITRNMGWSSPITTDPERVQTIQFAADVNSGTKVQVTRV